ncbi:CPBP family intramembrane metalloprotease [Weissella confusa]|uniref:Type II CAAX endopeptidase family protein n=1 Tax=Weissella fermenti TaxID=2987699 RepID=A0ABT6D501_9LACO|nr:MULTISPECIES: type II CAAX endopeptidase family protein [Weissella]MBJ7689482.1 CPBP family intramembrane metalloprotease [Weissella confusa]MCW0928005.1 CPBP family intramembrane metalloprotease [Weissella sp. LMG 11983]MDF9300595.1 type II CAAX endopeptidase family protein [Weissella sp. BK2]
MLVRSLKTIAISIFGVAYLILGQFIGAMVAPVFPEKFTGIVSYFTYLLFVFITLMLFARFKKGGPESLGFNFIGIKWWWFVFALVLPWVLNLVMMVLLHGSIVPDPNLSGNNAIFTLIAAIISGLTAGFTEEMIFRGLLFSKVKEYSGTLVAVIFPSFVFAAAHILNGAISIASIIMLLLGGTAVGIMFSMIRIATGSIWAGALVHSVWDILIVSPLSESPLFSLSFNDSLKGNLLLSGGDFGIETSLPAILLYTLVALGLYYTMKKYPSILKLKY